MLEGGLTKVFCEGMIEIILIAMRNKKKDFLIPHGNLHSALLLPAGHQHLETQLGEFFCKD